MAVAAHRFNNDLRYRDGEHGGQTHLTPTYALDPIRKSLGGVIGLDPCTVASNPTRAFCFYTVREDGLQSPWHRYAWDPSVFCNPPYGKAREPWVELCMAAGERGQKVVLLIPAATDTRIFQRAFTSATETVFVRGRLKFGTLRENRRQHAASHGSAIIGWNVDLSSCSHLGMIARP